MDSISKWIQLEFCPTPHCDNQPSGNHYRNHWFCIKRNRCYLAIYRRFLHSHEFHWPLVIAFSSSVTGGSRDMMTLLFSGTSLNLSKTLWGWAGVESSKTKFTCGTRLVLVVFHHYVTPEQGRNWKLIAKLHLQNCTTRASPLRRLWLRRSLSLWKISSWYELSNSTETYYLRKRYMHYI